MSTFLITQTQFSDVRPIDPSVRLTGSRLWTILGTHLSAKEFAEFKTVFADPEPVEGMAATDWYTDWEEEGVPVARLDPARRDVILAEVGQICARIAQIADAIEADTPGHSDAAYLRAAIAIPNNNDYIYAFDGQPVIVAWGHRLAGAGKAPVPAGIWIKTVAPEAETVEQPKVQPDANLTATPTVLAATGVASQSGIGWLAWLLWAIFLILLLLILWLVLSACSIGSPQSTLSQRLGLLNHCPVPQQVAQAPVRAENDRASVLQQAIREAELAVAEDAQICLVGRRAEAEAEDEIRRAQIDTPPPPVEPTPTPAPDDQAVVDEADERVREAGGQTGELQVVLQWEGSADLDMSISCSSGRVSHSSRSACNGGELDVDANHEIDMDRPVENIRWTQMPPSGAYTVNVRNYNRNNDGRAETPFTVLVRQGDEERTYRGSAAHGEQVSVTEIIVE